MILAVMKVHMLAFKVMRTVPMLQCTDGKIIGILMWNVKQNGNESGLEKRFRSGIASGSVL